MTESFELRVVEKFANRLFRPDEGKRFSSGFVRIVKINGDDPRLPEVGRLQKSLYQEQKRSFFHGWQIIRKYSKQEIEAAALLQLKISSTFEPAGEECGTKYNEPTGCPRCGAGAKQITTLCLPERRIPKSKDVSRTIAGEIVVSRQVAELFSRHKVTGAELSPVQPNPSSSAESRDWFQLSVPSTNVEICAPTRVGIGPFDDDEEGKCRCPLGDLIGLNLLSEVSITSVSRGGDDIICSRQFIGVRRGLLRPERIILVSPKVRRLIASEKIKGVEVEVAHLV